MHSATQWVHRVLTLSSRPTLVYALIIILSSNWSLLPNVVPPPMSTPLTFFLAFIFSFSFRQSSTDGRGVALQPRADSR